MCADVPVPSGVSAEQPDSADFFGRGEQGFASQSFRLSFDLFEGDTSFRPIDFRIRFTPEFNLNFLQTRERGLVNIDVRDGTNRFDYSRRPAGRICRGQDPRLKSEF